MFDEVEVWELRERRTWRLISSSTSFEEIEEEYQRLLRRAARRLNRPGLHGGTNAAEYCDIVMVRSDEV